MNEGDIFKWSWKPALGVDSCGPLHDYHFWSRTGIVHDGRLLDTFWMNFGSSFIQDGWAESRFGGKAVRVESVDLEFVANFADLEEIRHGEEAFYRRSDVVDLRHPNGPSAPVYIRRGAERDPATMLALVDRRIADAKAKKEVAESRIEALAKVSRIIAGGETDVHIPW